MYFIAIYWFIFSMDILCYSIIFYIHVTLRNLKKTNFFFLFLKDEEILYFYQLLL